MPTFPPEQNANKASVVPGITNQAENSKLDRGPFGYARFNNVPKTTHAVLLEKFRVMCSLAALPIVVASSGC